jgi:hypothetical protein
MLYNAMPQRSESTQPDVRGRLEGRVRQLCGASMTLATPAIGMPSYLGHGEEG